jgi:flagellar biosynthesis protein FlhG
LRSYLIGSLEEGIFFISRKGGIRLKEPRVILATCEDLMDQYLINNASGMGIKISGQIRDQEALAHILEQERADVALLNRFLPGPLSITTIMEELKRKGIRPILLLVGEEDEEVIQAALELNIYDFLIGKYGPKQLLSVIKKPNTQQSASQYIATFYPTLEWAAAAHEEIETSLFETAKKNVLVGKKQKQMPVYQAPSHPTFVHEPQRSSALSVYTRPANQPLTIAVFSSRGGVGKSNLSINVAALLQKMGRSAIVIDTDVHQGVIGSILKVKTPFSVNDWINLPDEMDVPAIMQSVGKHRSGMSCLPSPLDYLGQPIKEEILTKILHNLKKCFSALVFDTDGKLTKSNLAILKEADFVIYVMTPDTSSLERHKQCVQRLIEYGIDQQRIRIILNDPHQRASKGDADYISQKMRPIPFGIVNYSRELQKCSEEGEPVAVFKERDGFSKSLKKLVETWIQPHETSDDDFLEDEKKHRFWFWKRR